MGSAIFLMPAISTHHTLANLCSLMALFYPVPGVWSSFHPIGRNAIVWKGEILGEKGIEYGRDGVRVGSVDIFP